MVTVDVEAGIVNDDVPEFVVRNDEGEILDSIYSSFFVRFDAKRWAWVKVGHISPGARTNKHGLWCMVFRLF